MRFVPHPRTALRVAAVSALLGAAGCGGGGGSEGETGGASPLRIQGLTATLEDSERGSTPRIRWTTRWRLCWEPVDGAESYRVTLITPEGADPEPTTVRERCFEREVASGVALRSGDRPGRDAQLALVRRTLSVSVAVRLPDGTLGPPSAEVPVGARYG